MNRLRFTAGNHVELLESGADYFPALEAAIHAAQCEVHLETYIFADDAVGQRIAAALSAAAQRQVVVRIMVDGFGAREFPEGLGQTLIAAGAELEVFRPEIAQMRFRRNRLRRLHRKLAVIDGRVAFVGGINVIDDNDPGNTPHMGARFDYAVRIEGPLVAQVHAGMRHLWRLVDWARLHYRPPPLPLTPCADTPAAGKVQAAFVIRDNLGHRRDIEHAYLAAISGADREILIASAYFLPGRRFRLALLRAAARGVKVTVLLQGRVEYALLHFATQALYDRLLTGGVRIFEYTAGFLHAKVGVIDGKWATVGSSNIDPFSLMLAREANVVLRDTCFADTLKDSLKTAMSRAAQEITLADLKRGGLAARLLRWFAYGMVRLLLGITRYGGQDYRE